MLIGQPPFTGDKTFDVLSRQVQEPAPEPVALRSDVPSWLNRAMLRMLAKKADERFTTVYRVIQALKEGTDSGAVMTDERARRPDTSPPSISVSRAMERLSARDLEVPVSDGQSLHPVPLAVDGEAKTERVETAMERADASRAEFEKTRPVM